jgi:hypothetical protein
MQLPDGYSEYCVTCQKKKVDSSTHCVRLQQALYGPGQAARQWWRHSEEVMKSTIYVPSPADPWIFINTSTNKSFIVIYMDDGGFFNTKENIDRLIKALSKAWML